MGVRRPSGITLSRSGRTIKASWKKGEKYSTTQYCWCYSLVSEKGNTINVHIIEKYGTTDGTHAEITIPSNKTCNEVRFEVRGKKSGKWSAWAKKTIKVYPPKKPSLDAEFIQTAMTTFTWKPVTDKHDRPISDTYLQTILVQDCPSGTDAIASLAEWKDAATQSKSSSGSITPVNGQGEDTGLISGKSYTRIVRVKQAGIAGESDWSYAKHVYADPYAATNVEGTVTKTEASLNCDMTWMTPTDAGHPIDEDGVVPEWAIATPAAGMVCRDDTSFDPLPAQASTPGLEGKRFTLDTPIGTDKCLFLRVTTKHDTAETHSIPVLAKGDSVGPLADPEFTEAPAITSSTITVKASNESEVPDSFIVDFLEREDGSVEVLGLHDMSTKVYQVTGVENARVGIKAYVGTWNGDLKEVQNVLMESPMVWSAGNVPVAPSLDDFEVEQSIVPNTVLVSWGYSWDDADACEISWSTEPDAWISTEDPESYIVLRGLENKLAIKGVEAGEPLYIRIRYLNGVDEDAILSPYSDIKNITISTVPAIPTLSLEKQFFTQGEDITCSWIYVTTDGTEQAQAEIAERIVTEEGGETVVTYEPLKSVTTEQKIVISNKWEVGTQHALAVRVANGSGNWSDWSKDITITIAEPVECHITQTSLESEKHTGNPIIYNVEEDEGQEVKKLDVELTPIQGGTPWQDTETDSKPYLFRAIPHNDHDINAEFDKIVGGTVAWNQIVQNGNFADTSAWMKLNPQNTLTISNGEAEVVTTQNSVAAGLQMNFASDYFKNGHKYYGVLTAKSSNGISYGMSLDRSSLNNNPIIAREALSTSYTTRRNIMSFDISAQSFGGIRVASANADAVAGETLTVKQVQVIDLTAMLGTSIADRAYTLEQGTAGAGIAWLKSYGFIKDGYISYNAGSLESVEATGHKTVGFNQWDEETQTGYWDKDTGAYTASSNWKCSKNYIPCVPNTQYYFRMGSVSSGSLGSVVFYDSGKNYIGAVNGGWGNTTVTTPANCYYMNFYANPNWFANDICINLSKPTGTPKNGDYLPYESHTYPLDSDLTLRGIFKLDADNNIYADGDEYESDGTVTRKYGIVDLGALDWSAASNSRFLASPVNMYASPNNNTLPHAIMSTGLYEPKTGNTYNATDKTYYIGTDSRIAIKDTSYSADATAFKTAMSGVYLVYELATPTTETADPFTNPQVCTPNGTEEYTTSNGVPAGHESRYADIFPITGHDSITVGVTGKNLVDEAVLFDLNGWAESDGVYSGYSSEVHAAYGAGVPTLSFSPNTQYTLSFNYGQDGASGIGFVVVFAYTDETKSQNYITQAMVGAVSLTSTAGKSIDHLELSYGANRIIHISAFQLEHGNTATSYEPYKSQSKTVTLPHTVYGAGVGVTSGNGKETWANIPSYNGETITEPWLSSMDEYVQGATPTTGAQVTYKLATPTDLSTTPTSLTLYNGDNVISSDGDMTMELDNYSLTEMPMTVTVEGAGTGGQTKLMIRRAEDYRIERPEGEDYTGFKDAVVYQNIYTGEAQQTIQFRDTHYLDDGARYLLYAVVEDDYGQTDDDEIPFIVDWNHKAVMPSATVEVTNIAKITIAESQEAEEGDYVDIYRRSIDGTELIYTGAEFGETYVDPYPTIGDFGYLVVGRNAYGDFIMDEEDVVDDYGQFAWFQLPAMFESKKTIIDFNGEQIQLYFNVDISHSWNKDFKKTKYLGGSIVGDYVTGVERTGNVNFVSIPMIEEDMLASMRRLAKYEGNCHIRTVEGSSFTACIQVSEDDNHEKAGFARSFSMAVDKVKPIGMDGMTEEDWEAQNAME